MTLLLPHPPAESLGRFVEGTLPDSERSEVVAHIADCDECRILVVDAAEFIEPAKRESTKWSQWGAIAAALILSAGLGGFGYRHFHDPLADVKRTYEKVPVRPFEARLSGFRYVPWHVNRGGEDDVNPAMDILKGEAARATELRGNDARTLETRGVCYLIIDSPEEAVSQLQGAADHAPNNVKYLNDLAAALIQAGRNKKPLLERALAVCDRALQIDPRSADVLFNRALALDRLDRRPEAIAAYDRYLVIDPKSPWADEAKRNRERDKELLRPLP